MTAGAGGPGATGGWSRPWSWDDAARRAGVDRDGRLNMGAQPYAHPRALVYRRSDGTQQDWSGEALHALARRVADVLRRAGVRPGERVAGLLGRSPASYAVPLAAWRLGAVYVPLFAGFRSEALRVRIADAGATVVVTDPANRASLAEAQQKLPDLTVLVAGLAGAASGAGAAAADGDDGDLDFDALVAAAPEHQPVHPTHRTDASTIMYTSGTTGPPKGCTLQHHSCVTLLPFLAHCLTVTPQESLFSTADTGWSFGLFTTGVAPFSAGCSRLFLEGGYDPAAWWQAMRDNGSTHLASAPTGFRQLAAAGSEAIGPAGPPPSLRAATSGGEPLDPEVIRWWQEHVGVTIHDAYGLTELGMVVGNPRGPGAPDPVPGSMGYAIPGFEIGLLEDGGGEVHGSGEGRVAVRDNGWLLGSGYWGRQPEWDARLQDGWWVTEDVARRDDAGRLWYQSRSDDVIVTAGYNVGPFEVEAVLLEHPLVADSAVVGVPDERKGQVIEAHVVLTAGTRGAALAAAPTPASAELTAELKRWVGERIGWHAAPRHVTVHATLPRTESGKVKRRELRGR